MTRMFYLCAGLLLLAPAFAKADDALTVKELLDKVLKAQGGEAALGKVVSFEAKMQGFSYEGDNKTPIKIEATCQGYDKSMSVETNPDTKAEAISVVNGNEGWTKDGDKPAATMSDAQLKSSIESNYLNWITTAFPFKEKQYKLSPLDEIEVDGHKAVGFLVKREKHEPVKFYFDKESYLLVKTEHDIVVGEAGAQVTEVGTYTDHKTVHGIKQPFKMSSYWNGTKIADTTIDEMKIREKPVDERLFSKP